MQIAQLAQKPKQTSKPKCLDNCLCENKTLYAEGVRDLLSTPQNIKNFTQKRATAAAASAASVAAAAVAAAATETKRLSRSFPNKPQTNVLQTYLNLFAHA